MYIVDKPQKYICGIFRSKSDLDTYLAEIGDGFRVRTAPFVNYPFYILEQPLENERFTFHLEEPVVDPDSPAILYTIHEDYRPTRPGADQMGRLDHRHCGDD